MGNLKAERNAVSKEIGRSKDAAERQAKIEAMRLVGEQIETMDKNLREVEENLNYQVACIPNLPDPRTPVGKDDSENIVLHTVGKIPEYDFEPKPHWELGPALGIINFEQGREDHRLAFLRAERGWRTAAAGLDRLDA